MSISREQSEALVALIEGSLAPEAVRPLRERLLAEPELRAEYDGYKAVDAALMDLAAAEPPADDFDFSEAIMARVESLKAPEADRDTAALMAYIDGELLGAEAVAVERTLAASPALAEDERALSALHAELIALGDMPRREIEVDLLPGVLSRMELLRRVNNVTPFRPAQAPAQARRQRPPLALMAAAAMLCLMAAGMWYATQRAVETPGAKETVLAQNAGAPQAAPQAPESAGVKETLAPVVVLPQPETPGDDQPETGPAAQGAPVDRSAGEIARRWREDLDDKTHSLGKLATMAKLSADEARQIVATRGATPEALLGASQYLPAEQARMVLDAMAKNNPNDPYPRMAMAMLNDGTRTPEQMTAEMQAWGQADPENALPLYMEAQTALAQGRTAEALDLLSAASDMESASLYSLDAARQREQALIAAGVSPDSARMLAAGTAGASEATSVRSISTALMDRGRDFQAAGDYQTAQAIYESVQQLGQQVDRSAQMSQERLAGMDSQSQAIQALLGLTQMFNNTENLQTLTQSADVLAQGIAQLTDYLGSLGNTLGADATTLAGLAGLILTNGDLLLNLIR